MANSIYYENNKENILLWENIDYKIDLKNEKIIYEDIIYKKKSNKIDYKKKYFILTSKHLAYKDKINDKNFKGIIINDWIKFEYEILKNDDFKVKIRFTKFKKFVDLFLKKDNYEKWINILKKNFINSNFHENYLPLKMIGKGSFASVYLVKNRETNEKFAVKAFSKDYLKHQKKGLTSLINEINIIKNTNHKNILEFIEIHETENSIYIITELLKGGDLVNYLYQSNTMKDCYKVMKCILDALFYLHSNEIMHRDLKPDNIILKEKVDKLKKSELKLVDFGLATKVNTKEFIYKKCGTPGFIAPEILKMESKDELKYNEKCDIFSAGIIFYILLKGNSPFYNFDHSKILDLNKECNIDFSELEKKYENKIIDLLKKMLKINPKERLSAEDCLNHEFFNKKNKKKEEDEIKNSKVDFKNLKFNNFESIEVRENLINGEIETIKDYNSNNSISSKKLILINKKNKRDSLYCFLKNKSKTSESEEDIGYSNVSNQNKRKSKFNENEENLNSIKIKVKRKSKFDENKSEEKVESNNNSYLTVNSVKRKSKFSNNKSENESISDNSKKSNNKIESEDEDIKCNKNDDKKFSDYYSFRNIQRKSQFSKNDNK